MLIGFTYDLRDDYRKLGYSEEETAEFDPVETIDAVDAAIRACGHETERIGGLRKLVGRLSTGAHWDLVFNICEGMHGFGREAAVPALLDEYSIPYVFSGPLTLSVTLHKGIAKTLVRSAGVRTADFAVVTDPGDIPTVDLPFPLFVKPVAEGSSKGIDAGSLARDLDALEEKCLRILRDFRQPALVERFLPGEDITVSLLGSGNSARVVDVTRIVHGGDGEDFFSFRKKENLVSSLESAEGAERGKCEDLALAAWKALGCRDAGRVDIRLDANGEPNFIEVNPLPEIHPDYSELTRACRNRGISYTEMIRSILESAISRIPQAPGKGTK
jgi:D-alanine-D-alanine ligase